MNRASTFKLSDRALPDRRALAVGGTVLFETRSIDTVGGTTAFDLTRPRNRTLAIGFKFKSPTFVSLNFTVHACRSVDLFQSFSPKLNGSSFRNCFLRSVSEIIESG